MTEKIVDFTWCKKCIHEDKAENEDPCWDCLNTSTNQDSHRPVSFKEAVDSKIES